MARNKPKGPPIKPLHRQRWRLPKLSEREWLELVRDARREKAKLDALPYDRARRARPAAIEELLKHGHAWVLALTKKKRTPDRVAVGTWALWRAFLAYDLTRNQPIQFKTLAWTYIEQALANEARAERRARRKAGESYSDDIASRAFRHCGSDRPNRWGGWDQAFDADQYGYVEREGHGYRVLHHSPQAIEIRILVDAGHRQKWLDWVGGGVGAAKPKPEPENPQLRYRRIFSTVLTGAELDEMEKRLSVPEEGPPQKFETGPRRHNGNGAVVLQRIADAAGPRRFRPEPARYVPSGVCGLIFNEYD